MSYLSGLAARLGASPTSIEKFLATGESAPGIATALGTDAQQVTQFLAGRTAAGIATMLGLHVDEAQKLRDQLGHEGAIGLLLGLACARGTGTRRTPLDVIALE